MSENKAEEAKLLATKHAIQVGKFLRVTQGGKVIVGQVIEVNTDCIRIADKNGVGYTVFVSWK